MNGEESDIGRYVILGTIDGVLAILGIIVGISTTSVDSSVIIKAALGGGIALCLTNGIGSYLAESAVEYGKLTSVEKAILQDLKDTKIEQVTKRKILRDSIIHGGSSLLGSIIPIIPFIFLRGGISTIISIALSLGALVLLGLYSGKISSQSYIKSVVRMVALGALIVITCSLLGLGHI